MENSYKELFENMQLGLASCRLIYVDEKPVDFTYLFTNKAFEILTGLTNIVGKKVSEAIPNIQTTNPELFETYGRVVKTGKAESFQTHVESLKGWFSVYVYKLGTDTFGTVIDNITEAKKIEESVRQIQLVVDNSLDAIIGETFDGIITSWNGGAERMFGYKAKEMIGNSLTIMLPPEMKGELPLQLNRIRKGEIIADFDTIRLRKNGTRINVAVSMSPVKTEKGELVGASVVERDITTRKKAEESMRQIQLVVDNSYDALIGTNLDGIVTSWSGGAERMFGYTTLEMIGRSSGILNPPELKDEVKFLLDKVATGEPVIDYDSVRLKRDGTKIDVSFSTAAIQTKDGTLIGVSSVIRDNTNRKKAEESMRQIQLVVDNSVDAIIGENLDGIVTSWSGGAERMLGYKYDEIIGKSILVLYPSEIKSELGMFLTKIKAGEAIIDRDTVRIRKDGTKIDISLSISPIKDKSGIVTGAALAYRDITQRKKEEEVLRQIQLIVENSHDAIIGEKLDGTVTSWNGGAVNMFGYSKEEMIGKSLTNLFPIELKDELPQLLTKVSKGIVIADYDSVWIKKDKTRADVEFSLSPVKANVEFSLAPIKDQEGKIIGTSLVGRDITERKKDLDHIKELNNIRSKFIEIMAHQLRTPIGAINWNLESILNGDFGKLDDTQYKFLHATHESSTKLTRRIGELLTAMDIEEGRITFQKEEVSIDNLLGTTIESVMSRCKLKSITCEYTPPLKELPTIIGDGEKMRTVIFSMLDNAIIYTKETGKIVVKLSSANDTIRFEVTDTGIGVPEPEKHRLFTRFFRASNASLMQPDSFGLGLFTAKSFIGGQGGTIGFESLEGKGSTFWFTMPIKSNISNAK